MSLDVTEEFIEKVKSLPVLYDSSHPNYKNMLKKNKKWKTIGEEFEMDSTAAKRKWKNLRDTYMKYLKCLNSTTGRAAKQYYGHWQWASKMNFLKPFINSKLINSNLTEEQNQHFDDLVHESSSISSDDEISKTEKHSSVSKEPLAESWILNPIEAEKLSPPPVVIKTESHSHNQPQEMDELEHLFMGHAKSVKKLSVTRQTIIKMKVAQIIAEHELLEIAERARFS